MSDIFDVINKITIDNEYATDICLLLYLNENYSSLHYLDYLNITGRDLEILVEKCCVEPTIVYITQTIRFLRSGFLSNDEIKENLHSKNPITFIDRLMNKGEDWDHVYENYAARFRSLKNNKAR